ncbi:hypothetical protein, conserved [Eimeria tenella]|uniref:Uncharacterized protein n=1 Tax=Eimeria tenella TaxID=5802 RepID=U6KRE9_EIMTE|nr:hypothetical protein, conserved [Eimeria tenella]CDJ40546.1 hypothetical protein, conserved [Eimeria tenella]|eukprot:XP_013231296.1 hypothetical protein, conserved [Eimeria tenella]
MESHIGELELECREACRRLGKSVDAVKGYRGDEASILESLLANCRRDANLCTESLRQLELEARFETPLSAQDPHASQVLAELRQQLRTLTAEVDAAERRTLTSSREARNERLSEAEAKMNEGCKQLERAHMLALETEQVGSYVSATLAAQRQSIMRTRSHASHWGLSLAEGRASISRMLRAARRRHWVLLCLAVCICCCMLYLMLSRALWRLGLCSSSSNKSEGVSIAEAENPAALTGEFSERQTVPGVFPVPNDVATTEPQEQQQQEQLHQSHPHPLTGRDKFNILQRLARERREHEQQLQQMQHAQQEQPQIQQRPSEMGPQVFQQQKQQLPQLPLQEQGVEPPVQQQEHVPAEQLSEYGPLTAEQQLHVLQEQLPTQQHAPGMQQQHTLLRQPVPTEHGKPPTEQQPTEKEQRSALHHPEPPTLQGETRGEQHPPDVLPQHPPTEQQQQSAQQPQHSPHQLEPSVQRQLLSEQLQLSLHQPQIRSQQPPASADEQLHPVQLQQPPTEQRQFPVEQQLPAQQQLFRGYQQEFNTLQQQQSPPHPLKQQQTTVKEGQHFQVPVLQQPQQEKFQAVKTQMQRRDSLGE